MSARAQGPYAPLDMRPSAEHQPGDQPSAALRRRDQAMILESGFKRRWRHLNAPLSRRMVRIITIERYGLGAGYKSVLQTGRPANTRPLELEVIRGYER